MSLVIAGNAANVTSPLARSVVGMADNGSGAIRVQTSAPHLFATGDYVHIQTITTVINTYYTITVIDATHFDLDGSTYTGTGTGTAIDASLTPQIQVPTDGDTASLQLSGMLSALQALADRTQALKKTITQRTTQSVIVLISGSVVIPPWSTHALIFGSGGGGGGGGGQTGTSFTANAQNAAGGGGAGAPLGCAAVLSLAGFGATRLIVVVGPGGNGGALVSGGIHGDASTVAYQDGILAGTVIAQFYGGSGGGGGRGILNVVANSSGTPIYTPGGGAGPGGIFRNGGESKRTRTSPGPSQTINIQNNTGVIDSYGAWIDEIYTDPVGQMSYCEGGASMAIAENATYAAGVSYDGAPSNTGYAGGSAGTEGTGAGAPGTRWIGGAAGGGGGGGAFGAGGDGGNGGNGSTGSGATAGTAGASAVANTGGGGGGGGTGGAGATAGTGGTGGVGGSGASGAVWIFFLGAPSIP